MKKSFFYAMAAVAALSACTANGELDETVNIPTPSDQEISLMVTAPTLNADTRGTGTVGSVEGSGAANVWQGQRIRVYMLNKGTLTPTKLSAIDEDQSIFENAEVYAPTGVDSGLVTRETHTRSYYPISGASDFWGYRTDGAETSDKGLVTDDGTQMYMPFTIDGSQDVMVGKTDNSTITTLDDKYLYSAKSARTLDSRGQYIRPNLIFNHLLTRITFEATSYNQMTAYSEDAARIPATQVEGNGVDQLVAADVKDGKDRFGTNCVNLGVYIDSVMVESATTGELVFAYTPQAQKQEQYINWDMTKKSFLRIKSRQEADADVPVEAKDLKPFAMTQVPTSSYKQLGEALLVAPAETYKIRVAMHQYMALFDEDEAAKRGGQMYRRISMTYPNNNIPMILDLRTINKKIAGKPGYSYNVKLGVSGLEIILLDATLNAWKKAGDDAIKDIL